MTKQLLLMTIIGIFSTGTAYATQSEERRTFVICDIDDTAKRSNVGSVLKAAIRLQAAAYEDARKLLWELAEEESATIAYVSSSYAFLYDGPTWLQKHEFPKGTVYQRTKESGESATYKRRTIIGFLRDQNVTPQDRVLLLGDNQEYDYEVYKHVVNELELENAEIKIRNIRGTSENMTPSAGSLVLRFHAEPTSQELLKKSPYWEKRLKKMVRQDVCKSELLDDTEKRRCLQCVGKLVHESIDNEEIDYSDYISPAGNWLLNCEDEGQPEQI